MLKLSSRDITGPDKAAALREFYGRELMRLDVIAQDTGGPTYFDARIANLSWATWAACDGSAFAGVRTKPLLEDGCDDLFFAVTTAGLQVEVGQDAFAVQPGGALLLSKARAYRYLNNGPDKTACILVPRARMAMLLPHLGEAPHMHFAPGTAGLDLVFGYASLVATSGSATPELREKAAAHLLELMASIIDPGREAGGASDPERLAEARFEAIKRSIRSNLLLPGLSLERIAQLHGITPRYVQRLFERSGDSFSDFVRRERLAQAWLTLTDPRQAGRRILSVALECGFNDITTFNRAFRRTFGVTPREARENRLRQDR
ncbi:MULTISPECIES: AraC family transcriptional regulator [Chelatococcus]|uniref:AraC-like DNA-binding protein n=1 Tax=Chelatococcus caeni TaxID=1348468 RepID=A0A840CC72_9HYPH|nr:MULTISPECIES: AraC family transcriptional regulator [Chelatococcus]ALA16828.1 hypothetical protein AL346_04650 [Chelatococcus sp. CO-6]MBB4019857.1 AraC-like DNA-binding protein [Chelatococcus caeni]